jgi:hypothetical protein
MQTSSSTNAGFGEISKQISRAEELAGAMGTLFVFRVSLITQDLQASPGAMGESFSRPHP